MGILTETSPGFAMSAAVPTSTEERALTLLGQNVPPAQVASAIGVSESMISQLVSKPEFSAKVFELRYKNLIRHNARDDVYDNIEDSLANKLKDLLPLMMRPMEVLKAISVINAVKRRGMSSPDSLIAQKQVVQLVMPVQIIKHFTTNINNQIIKAGDKDLTTVQSGAMQNLLEASQPKSLESVQTIETIPFKENSHVQIPSPQPKFAQNAGAS